MMKGFVAILVMFVVVMLLFSLVLPVRSGGPQPYMSVLQNS